MNLKRAFVALGAMILGVGFFGASPAFATCTTPVHHPTTQQPTASYSTYPENGFMWRCGASVASTDANVVKNAANSATASPTSVTPPPQPYIRYLLSGNPGGTAGPTVDVYAMESWTDAKTYFNLSAVPPPGTTPIGYTIKPNESSVHPGIAVLVFNAGNDHTKNTRTTNHEIGHAVDLVLGQPSGNILSQFRTKLSADFTAFDAPGHVVNWSNYGGTAKPGGGTCSGSNSAIMTCKWPNDTSAYELFANAYGVNTAGGINNIDLQHLLIDEFDNTMLYMQNLQKGATSP